MLAHRLPRESQLRQREIAHPDESHLAGINQSFHGSERFLQRNLVVRLMELIQVNMISAEASQTFVGRLKDVGSSEMMGRNLCGKEHTLAPPRQGCGNNVFCSIGLSRVDEQGELMTTVSLPADKGTTPPWRDTTLSVADRVQLLLTEMTLEEKVAQLGSRWVGNDMKTEPFTEPSPAVGLSTTVRPNGHST